MAQERLITQIDYARAGKITPQMEAVAAKEHKTPEEIRAGVAKGRIAIPANIHHAALSPEGVGEGMRTKVNVNLGISGDLMNAEMELEKVRTAIELGAEGIPCIRVYNKCDAAFTAQQEREQDAVYISARTGEGIPALLEAVDKRLDKGTKRVVIHLPYDKAGLLDGLYREAKVEGVEYGETVDVTAVCTPRIMGRLKAYIEGWVEPKEDWE